MLNLTLILRKYTLDFAADEVPILQLWNQKVSKQVETRKVQFKNTKGDKDTQMRDGTAVLVCNMCAWAKRSTAEARLEFMSTLRQN